MFTEYFSAQRQQTRESLSSAKQRWAEMPTKKRCVLGGVFLVATAITGLSAYGLYSTAGWPGLSVFPVIAFFAKRRAFVLLKRYEEEREGLVKPKQGLMARLLQRKP